MAAAAISEKPSIQSSLLLNPDPKRVDTSSPMIANRMSESPTSPISPLSPISPSTPHTYAQPQPSQVTNGVNIHPYPPISDTSSTAGPSKIPNKQYKPHLISHHLLKHPDHTVKRAIHAQFPKPNPIVRLARRFKVKHSVIKGMTKKEWKHYECQADEIRRKAGWKEAGKEGEGVEVSELFWKMYMSLLPTLQRDPLSGLVPPDLLGSTTTMPLTIISLIPDIMQHYHDVMIRAQKEIFLATNYWQPSNSVKTISNTLRELSDLVIKEKREKIVVKLMYDRGSFEQLWNSHAPVAESKWAPLDMPSPDEIPGLHFEVVNFHRVLLGTFHAKFLIVDRKVALINSNNIQDRPNLELMSHLEGPIVDAFYEVALHSWYNRLSPPLPCMSTPYQPPLDSLGNIRYTFQHDNPFFDDIEVLKAAKAARLLLRRQTLDTDALARSGELQGGGNVDRLREAVRKVVDQQRASFAEWKPGERLDEGVQSAMQELRDMRDRFTAGMSGDGGKRSRPGSRGPSRRTSANEGMFRNLLKGAEKPAEHSSVPIPVDPSEARTSVTMIDTPYVKSKSQPQPNQHNDLLDPVSNQPSRPTTPSTAGPKTHVTFAPLQANVAGDGKFMSSQTDLSSSTNQPGTVNQNVHPHPFPSIASQGVLTDSPAASSIKLETPRTTHNSLPSESAKGGPSILNKENDGKTQGGVTRHIDYNQPNKGSSERLPVTAMMPDEIKSSSRAASIVAPTPPTRLRPLSPNEMNETNGEVDDEVDRNTLDDRVQGEIAPVDSVVPEGQGSSKRLYKMSKMFNAAGVLSEAWATVEDSDDLDNFRPHVIHAPHNPIPVAMCCRKPHGFPGHHDIRNPQNAAWLAGFRYAKKKVFVQSPTLNARPIVRAIKQACRRGVEVVLLLDLGFNDKGESIPFQGGTNEEVVDRLYKTLKKDKKEQYLKVYWYTGKDQVRPLNAVKKQRNCHIKFAAYDDEVVIIGNGNQDSQSWFHSQEVNIMVESKQICKEMMEVLLGNQNTIEYGLVDTDGIWRDKDGKTLKDYGATGGGTFRGLSGFIAFAKTI